MAEYYWELVLKDGSSIEIPPQAAPLVQKKMANKEVVNLRTRSIPYSEIKEFRQTAKAFGQPPLLDDVARAFNEPVETTSEWGGRKYQGVAARWVKRRVTPERWQNYYSKTTYRRLGEDGGMVLVAYVLPVHSIDLGEVQYCTEEEVAKLEK